MPTVRTRTSKLHRNGSGRFLMSRPMFHMPPPFAYDTPKQGDSVTPPWLVAMTIARAGTLTRIMLIRFFARRSPPPSAA